MVKYADIPNTDEDKVTATSSGEQTENKEVTLAQEDDGSAQAAKELQRQLDEMRKSEESSRRRADQVSREKEEALRRARDRDQEITKVQKENVQYKYESITNAIAAATAEAESARRDISSSIAAGDPDGQAAAYDRLASAKAALINLENGKVALEEQHREDEARRKEAASRPQQTDPLDNSPIPESAKRWLRDHPEYLSDPRKNAKIQSLHWDILDEGLDAFSSEYFESMERHLGMRKAQAVQEDRDVPVSAPVSRSTPSNSSATTSDPGRVSLTKEQREAASMAGITELEYAKQLIKLRQEKSNGNYGESR